MFDDYCIKLLLTKCCWTLEAGTQGVVVVAEEIKERGRSI